MREHQIKSLKKKARQLGFEMVDKASGEIAEFAKGT